MCARRLNQRKVTSRLLLNLLSRQVPDKFLRLLTCDMRVIMITQFLIRIRSEAESLIRGGACPRAREA